jgi:hypothetical protein
MSGETPVHLEPTARAIANENFDRFGVWLVGDELSEQQRLERLKEIFACVAHDGVVTGLGIVEYIPPDRPNEDLLAEAEMTGYINAITDIDKGQGAQ